jgi:hypothetical protein
VVSSSSSARPIESRRREHSAERPAAQAARVPVVARRQPGAAAKEVVSASDDAVLNLPSARGTHAETAVTRGTAILGRLLPPQGTLFAPDGGWLAAAGGASSSGFVAALLVVLLLAWQSLGRRLRLEPAPFTDLLLASRIERPG